jgi:SAM-dependent methyltransferase
MAQNVYDEAEFFAGYSQLPRSIHGLDGAAEWPTLRALVPPVAGQRVVDLGCGFGWFCRWAADQGAADVLGIDLSENMLERARRDTAQPQVHYERHDLDHLELAPASCELVYSSLTFHYLADLDRLFAQAARALVPGGGFVFSVEHPIFTAPRHAAFVDGPEGAPVWPLDRYLDEGPRVTDWLAPGIVKQHRTVGTYVNLMCDHGFVVDRLIDWGPSDEQVAATPEWAVEQERPPFLLVAAHRGA